MDPVAAKFLASGMAALGMGLAAHGLARSGSNILAWLAVCFGVLCFLVGYVNLFVV